MIKRILIVLTAAVFVLMACTDDKNSMFQEDDLFLRIRPGEMVFDKSAGTQKFVIVANSNDIILEGTANDNWCTYRKVNNMIEVSVTEFDEPEGWRSTTLKVKIDNITKEVKVKQHGPMEAPIERLLDWKVIFASTYVPGDGPERILDGNTATIWHSGYNSSHVGDEELMNKMPQWVIIDMGYTTQLDSVAICRRTDYPNHDAREVSIWVGDDSSGEEMVKIAHISLTESTDNNNTFGAKADVLRKGRYLKVVIEEVRAGRNVCQIGEFFGWGVAYK